MVCMTDNKLIICYSAICGWSCVVVVVTAVDCWHILCLAAITATEFSKMF